MRSFTFCLLLEKKGSSAILIDGNVCDLFVSIENFITKNLASSQLRYRDLLTKKALMLSVAKELSFMQCLPLSHGCYTSFFIIVEAKLSLPVSKEVRHSMVFSWRKITCHLCNLEVFLLGGITNLY